MAWKTVACQDEKTGLWRVRLENESGLTHRVGPWRPCEEAALGALLLAQPGEFNIVAHSSYPMTPPPKQTGPS